MKYKILLAVILIITFLAAGFLIYANNVLLPVKLKARIEQELEKNLHKAVSIGRLRYHLFRGLVFQNISVFDPATKENYLTVKEASFRFHLLPLLQKKIVIPLAHIDTPQFNLILRPDNTLNIADLLKISAGQKEKSGFSVFIYQLDLSAGKAKFQDQTLPVTFTKDITDIKIGAGLSLPGRIKFIVQAKVLNNISADVTFVSASGEYNLINQGSNAHLRIENIVTNDYLPYLTRFPFALSDGFMDADLKLDFKDKLLHSAGTLYSKNIKLRKGKFALSANIICQSDIKYDFLSAQFAYQANFEISNGTFVGFDYLKDISEIKGNLYLEKDKLWSENLKAKILDADVGIKGLLEDFSRPSLKISIASGAVGLNKLKILFPAVFKNQALSGESSVAMVIQGNLKDLPLEINGSADIYSGQIQLPAFKEPFSNIKGTVNFTNNQLAWTNFSFAYKGTPFSSTGNLINFKEPKSNFELTSKELALRTDLYTKDKIINVRSCSGKYLGSQFLLKGSINTPDNLWDIKGDLKIRLQDIQNLLPADASGLLKKIALSGTGLARGSLKGNIGDLKNLAAAVKFSSPSVSVYGLKMRGLYFTLTQKDGLLSLERFNARAYGGGVNLEFKMDLNTANSAYSSSLNLSEIDLAKLKLDTKLKDKDLQGILNLKSQIQGNANSLDTLQGSGSCFIKNGKIWEINLFKGMGELILLPIYQKILFDRAEASFTIRNKNIHIANGFFGGKRMDLAGEGNIGFDGALDLEFQTEINEDLIKESPDLRKFTSAVIGNLLVIRIKGTLEKPEYKVVPATKELIKEIKRFFSAH